MKKYLTLLLIIPLLLTSCSSSDTSSSNDAPAVTNPPAVVETKSEELASAHFDIGAGYYLVGSSIPPGTYNLTAIEGGGNVTTIMDYKLNEIMGTEEENKLLGMDLYNTEFKNLKLEIDDLIFISGNLILNFDTNNASTAQPSLLPQYMEEEITLGAGNYTADVDFNGGYYDIIAVSGAGNVTNYDMSFPINEVMGTREENISLGMNMYNTQFQNAKLTDGVVLSIAGNLKVTLQPSKPSVDRFS